MGNQLWLYKHTRSLHIYFRLHHHQHTIAHSRIRNPNKESSLHKISEISNCAPSLRSSIPPATHQDVTKMGKEKGGKKSSSSSSHKRGTTKGKEGSSSSSSRQRERAMEVGEPSSSSSHQEETTMEVGDAFLSSSNDEETTMGVEETFSSSSDQVFWGERPLALPSELPFDHDEEEHYCVEGYGEFVFKLYPKDRGFQWRCELGNCKGLDWRNRIVQYSSGLFCTMCGRSPWAEETEVCDFVLIDVVVNIQD